MSKYSHSKVLGVKTWIFEFEGDTIEPITEGIIFGEHIRIAICIQYKLRKQHIMGITLHSSVVAGVGTWHVEAGGGRGCQWYWPCKIGLTGSEKLGFALCHSHVTLGLSTLFRKNLPKQPLHLMRPFKEYLQQTRDFWFPQKTQHQQDYNLVCINQKSQRQMALCSTSQSPAT